MHTNKVQEGKTMDQQMYVFTFPLWKRGKEWITDDAKVVAANQKEAAEKLWAEGVHNEWVIGDCRHAAFTHTEGTTR
jgi:hypothetical protein